MTLSEIQDMWVIDCKINHADLQSSAIGVPQLHAKYLNLLTNTKLQLRKSKTSLIQKRKTKAKWFRGELSKEELDTLGWDQYLFKKPLKSEIDYMIDSEDDIIAHIEKLEYLETVCFQLESILKSVNSRTWDIKNTITIRQFENGGF